MSMPVQKPGRSKQDYQTPPELLNSLKRLLRIDQFDYDLAASNENSVAPRWHTEADNALEQDWSRDAQGWCFCNPPFSDITPWVKKAWEESQEGASIVMLLPASVGSNWWAEWVHDKAQVLFIRPRITFVGAEDPYPKDCAILVYTNVSFNQGGYDLWDWRGSELG